MGIPLIGVFKQIKEPTVFPPVLFYIPRSRRKIQPRPSNLRPLLPSVDCRAPVGDRRFGGVFGDRHLSGRAIFSRHDRIETVARARFRLQHEIGADLVGQARGKADEIRQKIVQRPFF